jgi:hypothetical protein
MIARRHICSKGKLRNMVSIMVSNTTFNNISRISWWLVVLIEKIGVPGENHRPVISHGQSLSDK